MTSHSAQPNSRSLPPQDVIKIVRDVMRYMLFTVPKTKDAPVPKSELTSLVTKISKERGLPDVVICTAQLKFLENFGMEMAELTKRKKAVPAKKALKGAAPQRKVTRTHAATEWGGRGSCRGTAPVADHSIPQRRTGGRSTSGACARTVRRRHGLMQASRGVCT